MVKEIENRSDSMYGLMLIKVLEAKQRMVAARNYKLKLLVGEISCRKPEGLSLCLERDHKFRKVTIQ